VPEAATHAERDRVVRARLGQPQERLGVGGAELAQHVDRLLRATRREQPRAERGAQLGVRPLAPGRRGRAQRCLQVRDALHGLLESVHLEQAEREQPARLEGTPASLRHLEDLLDRDAEALEGLGGLAARQAKPRQERPRPEVLGGRDDGVLEGAQHRGAVVRFARDLGDLELILGALHEIGLVLREALEARPRKLLVAGLRGEREQPFERRLVGRLRREDVHERALCERRIGQRTLEQVGHRERRRVPRLQVGRRSEIDDPLQGVARLGPRFLGGVEARQNEQGRDVVRARAHRPS
jgi:hypothetical protein